MRQDSWDIKGKDNEVKFTVGRVEHNDEWMQERYVTVTVESPCPINFAIGDYLIYREERFEINYDPGKIKSAPRFEKGDAFRYENVKFNSLADELTRCDFLDVVPGDNQLHFTGLPKFTFYGGVKSLADRIQANLDRSYGKNTWQVVIAPEFESDMELNVSVDTIKVSGALEILVNQFKTYYTIKGRTLTIGAAGVPADHLFKYGKGNGLYEIEENAEADQQIVTRLRAYGSTRNIPHRYYNSLTDADGVKLIPDNMAVQYLMLPEFPYTTQDPYIDSKNIDALGVREGTIFFDGSGDLEEIYPSIEGMTAEQLKAAGVPCNAEGALDVLVGAEQMTDNGVGKIEGDAFEGNATTTAEPATFKVTIPDIGFDIKEHIIEGNSESPTLSFKTGMLGGRDFEIVECKKQGDNYVLELNRVYDEDIKLWFPYKDYNAKANDKFVLLNIRMPEVYIKAASQRLLEAAEKWLEKNDYSRSIYSPKIDENFMARQHDAAMASGGTIKSLHDTLCAGMQLLFEDEDLGIDAAVFIDRLTIIEGDGPIPTYEVVLKEEKTVGRLDKMQNQIDSLAAGQGQGSGGYNASQIRSLINAYGGQIFLSKLKDDRSAGKVASDKGFEVGDYVAWASGAMVGKDAQTGKTFAEVDYLYARVKAYFESLTIIEANTLAGKQYITPGGSVKCTGVEEVTDAQGNVTAYRCFFLSEQDGEKTDAKIIAGDQAISEMFNAKEGTANKVSNHRWWRLVTAVEQDAYTDENGNHYGYIEVSKSDCEAGSDEPKEGDVIAQLGNRTDATRQSAMVFSTVDADAPSIKMYSGIDSYSLDDKAIISFGRDPLNNQVFFRLGNSTAKQYLNYTQQGGLEVAGRISTKSTIDGKSVDDYIREIAPEFDDDELRVLIGYAQGAADNAQDSADKALADASDASDAASDAQDTADAAATLATSAYSKATAAEALADSYKYLKENLLNAVTDSTQIIGGLILSTMIELGYTEGGARHILSGMNGSYNPELGGRTPAAWYGGNMVDRFDALGLPYATPPANAAASMIRMDGSAYLGGGAHVFNVDGSGYLANGNIRWDAAGIPTIGSDVIIKISENETLNSALSNLSTHRIGVDNLFVVVENDAARTEHDLSWAAITANQSKILGIKAKYGFFSDEWVSARGLNPFANSGQIGASALTDLTDVALTNPASGQALVFNGTEWVNQKVGIDASVLSDYAKKADIPSLTGYAKQDWVEGKGYITASALAPYLKADDAASTYLAQTAFSTFKSGYDTWKGQIDAFKAEFESLFQKESDGNGGFRIKALFGLYTDEFLSARGLNANAGGGISGGLDWDEIEQKLTANGYAKKTDIPSAVDLTPYALNSSLTAHTGDIAVHITANERTLWNQTATNLSAILGSDTDNIINKYEEIIAFLDTYTEADTLANLLSNKADKATTLAGYGITNAYTKTEADSRYVNVDGDNMTGTLHINGGFLGINGNYLTGLSDGGFQFMADGSLTMEMSKVALYPNGTRMLGLPDNRWHTVYASTVNASSKIKIGDGEIIWDADKGGFKFTHGIYSEEWISARGANAGASGGVSGGLDEESLAQYLFDNGYATQQWVSTRGYVMSSALANYALRSEIPSLTGYAKEQWVLDKNYLTAVAWGDVTDKPTWIGSSKPSYAFSEITSKPTTLAGYGITDAKIAGGVITLGSNTITPITSLAGYATTSWVDGKGYLTAITKSQVEAVLTGSISSHTHGQYLTAHQALDHINNLGLLTAVSDTTTMPSGLRLYSVYNNGYPTTYGNLLRIGGSGSGELLCGWTADTSVGGLYYRSKRDVATTSWSAWSKVAFTTDIPTKVSQLTNDSGYLNAHQSLANYVTLNTSQTITGMKTFTAQPGITIQQATKNWAYIRMKSGDNFWDIATNDNISNSMANNALEFRCGGVCKGAFIRQSGSSYGKLGIVSETAESSIGYFRNQNTSQSVGTPSWTAGVGIGSGDSFGWWYSNVGCKAYLTYGGTFYFGAGKGQVGADDTYGAWMQYGSHYINVRSDGLWHNNSYRIWDSGNDGSGSGLDADLLDGLHASSFAKGGSVDAITIPGGSEKWVRVAQSSSYVFNAIISLSNPYNYFTTTGVVFSVCSGYRSASTIMLSQLGGHPAFFKKARVVYPTASDGAYYIEVLVSAINEAGRNPYHIRIANAIDVTPCLSYTAGGIPSGYASKELEFTYGMSAQTFLGSLSGNATSATKLLNTRTIWGQNFNGEGNVSGNMTGVGSITASGTIKTTASQGFLCETATGVWSYARYKSNTTLWDVAVKDNDLSGALQFRYNGADANRVYITTGGTLYAPKGQFNTATSTYALNAASFICDSWVRTSGVTGWYNETYAGGIYMTDTNWIRTYNSKPFLSEIASNNAWGIGGHRLNAVFAGTSHSSILLAVQGGTTAYGICANSNGNMYFGKRTSGSYTNTTGDAYLMTLNETGLRIGDSANPSCMLDVAGEVKTHRIIPAADNTYSLGSSSARWSFVIAQRAVFSSNSPFSTTANATNIEGGVIGLSKDSPYISFFFNNATTYTTRLAETAAGHLVCTGTFKANVGIYSDGYVSARGQNTSDIRLKTDIRDFNASDIIKALRPVSFKWNALAKSKFEVFRTDETQYGLIAQETETVAPWLVDRNMFNDGLWGVKYGKLIPILTQGVREVVFTVDDLLVRVKRLESSNKRLEDENKELKRKIEILERR